MAGKYFRLEETCQSSHRLITGRKFSFLAMADRGRRLQDEHTGAPTALTCSQFLSDETIRAAGPATSGTDRRRLQALTPMSSSMAERRPYSTTIETPQPTGREQNPDGAKRCMDASINRLVNYLTATAARPRSDHAANPRRTAEQLEAGAI